MMFTPGVIANIVAQNETNSVSKPKAKRNTHPTLYCYPESKFEY